MREFTVILRATPEFEAETSTTPYIRLVKANSKLQALLEGVAEAELTPAEVRGAIILDGWPNLEVI